MSTNYKKLFAMKKQAEEKILKECPYLHNFSGIYVLTRFDENGFKFAYIGQAKHLLDRLVSHLNGYSQRIDISIKKRGLYQNGKKPFGWRLDYEYCPIEKLDEKEQETIKFFANQSYQLYNRTSGSQGEGKLSINDGTSTKGYREGLKQGYQNCLKDIREYFDKYLMFRPKGQPYCYKKDGTLKEIYTKKYNEFKEMLEGKENVLQEKGNQDQTR